MLSQTKCHKMHVGKKNEEECPCLFVRSEEMINVECDQYLGDYLSKDAKNDKNICEKNGTKE